MSANRTQNLHTHRIRHRRRITATQPVQTRRLRKLTNHCVVQATAMNAIVGVSGVSATEVLDSIRNNRTNGGAFRDIRARDQRGVTTVAEVEALGIPII